MQTDDVAVGKEFVELRLSDFGGKLEGGFGGVGMHFHAETDGNAGGVVAGLSQADDTDLLAAQFNERSVPEAEVGIAAPTSLAHFVGVVLHLLGYVEDVRKDHLGYGRGAVCRDVGDDNAPFFGSGNIDNVVSGGKDADVFQMGQRSYGICVEHNFIGQQNIRSGSAFRNFRRCSAVVNNALSQTFQFVPGKISGIGGITVENYYFHDYR